MSRNSTESAEKQRLTLVVGDEGWGRAIPEWLKERAYRGMLEKELQAKQSSEHTPDHERVSNAEVACYLYSMSLAMPISRDAAAIFKYLSWEQMRLYAAMDEEDIPKDLQEIADRELTDGQQRELREIKQFIFSKRGKIDNPEKILSQIENRKEEKT